MSGRAASALSAMAAVVVLLGAACTSQRIQPPAHQLIPSRASGHGPALPGCALQTSRAASTDESQPAGVDASDYRVAGTVERVQIPAACAGPSTDPLPCPDHAGWPAGISRVQAARALATWQVRSVSTRGVVVGSGSDARAATVVRLEVDARRSPALARWLSGCAAAGSLVAGSHGDAYALPAEDGWSPAAKDVVRAALG